MERCTSKKMIASTSAGGIDATVCATDEASLKKALAACSDPSFREKFASAELGARGAAIQTMRDCLSPHGATLHQSIKIRITNDKK